LCRSNDLESAGLFDELLQPLHVWRAARPARVVGPAVDVFLRPTVVDRAKVRDSESSRRYAAVHARGTSHFAVLAEDAAVLVGDNGGVVVANLIIFMRALGEA
jgi:hypothetical protein